jgi:hypothetical protein
MFFMFIFLELPDELEVPVELLLLDALESPPTIAITWLLPVSSSFKN